LSIVSKIIDGHHGSIRIENSSGSSGDGNKNRGACFVMFFPATKQQSPAAEKTHLVIS
jgi:nitrogen fixation/metabolism regulation signal transduction histidine kinase